MLRAIHDNAQTTLLWICDASEQTATSTADRYGCQATVDPKMIFDDPEVNAVYIATPPSDHFRLARAALAAGKHVLVEKPITTNSVEAVELVDLAFTNQ